MGTGCSAFWLEFGAYTVDELFSHCPLDHVLCPWANGGAVGEGAEVGTSTNVNAFVFGIAERIDAICSRVRA